MLHIFSVIDVCMSDPCINGECIVGPPGKYVCKCDFGFTGAHCEDGM